MMMMNDRGAGGLSIYSVFGNGPLLAIALHSALLVYREFQHYRPISIIDISLRSTVYTCVYMLHVTPLTALPCLKSRCEK